MKRQLCLLLLAFLLLLTACGQQAADKEQGEGGGQAPTVVQEINAPDYGEHQLARLLWQQGDSLLLGYISPGNATDLPNAKIVLADLAAGSFSELYTGPWQGNYFYDTVCLENEEWLYLLHRQPQSQVFWYNKANRQMEFPSTLLETPGGEADFTIYLADYGLNWQAGEQLDNQLNATSWQLTLLDGKGQPVGSPLTVDQGMLDYALQADGSQLAVVDIGGRFTVLDLPSGASRSFTLSQQPEGLLGYNGLAWLAEDKLLLSGLYENGDEFWLVVSSGEGQALAQYTAPDTVLAGCWGGSGLLLLRQGQQVWAWDYVTGQETLLFDIAGDYPDWEILSAVANQEADRLLLAISGTEEGGKVDKLLDIAL